MMHSSLIRAIAEAQNAAEPTFLCSCCNEEFSTEERMYVGEEAVCEGCFDEHTVTCACCGAVIWSDDNSGDSDTPLCGRCYDRHYTSCEQCGCLLLNDDVYHDADEEYPYCEHCYHQYHMGAIHDYNYKPDPIFYGDGSLFMGVELEIDGGGKDNSNAREILEIANQTAEHIYIKSDGSLDDGMEIVTHPCTLDYHANQFPWNEIVRRALDLGYLSHKTSTCGLHIHVNRGAFSDDYDQQEACIGRILFFMEKHWDELLRFSRRTEQQLNRWAARYGLKSSPKEILDHAKKGYGGRYTALNLNNDSTIEFRIFRGTLKYNTLIAALQLVSSICKAAISMSDEEMSLLSWTGFVQQITAPELIIYLKERRLYVNDPVEYEEDD